MTDQTGPEQAAQAPSEGTQGTNLYTRNPIQVEARQFFAYNGQSLANWAKADFEYRTSQYDKPMAALNLPGKSGYLEQGSWVIRLPDGMFIGLSDVDFQELYSPLYPSPTEDDTNDRG